MALERARGVCLEVGCIGFPVFGGRCKAHARWPKHNPDRPSGWEMTRLKAMLIAERGTRCEVCGSTETIELHHINGVQDNRPEALSLRQQLSTPDGRERGWVRRVQRGHYDLRVRFVAPRRSCHLCCSAVAQRG